METGNVDFDYTAFGLRLKAAREKVGLTQAQVCEAIGLQKPQVLSSYERGVSSPSIDTLASLALLYGCSLDDLVFADKKPSKRMTTGDTLYLLVRTLDELIIPPHPASEGIDRFLINRSATADLCWGENGIYSDFFNKWNKLYNARLDGLIDIDDYYHLLYRHASQVPDDPEYKALEKKRDESSKPGGVIPKLLSLLSGNNYDDLG